MRGLIMTTKKTTIIMAIILLLSIGVSSRSIAENRSAKLASVTSTVDDQTDIALTIYNSNLGLVKEQRTVKVFNGVGELKFMDVASQIIPTSVQIKSLADPESLQVLEQNYEYDLLNPEKLLDKYIGKEVRLYTKNPYTDREDVVTATLLSNNGQPIYKIGDDITFGYPGRVIFPKVPDDLIAKPTLVWLLDNSLNSIQKIEASYLTNNINWRSDYVVTLNAKDDKADLSGWVTIDNHSGASYKNAKLKLVAGDVNRVKEKMEYEGNRLAAAATKKEAAPQFKEESFSEYHIYTLERLATVKDNQTKQISLVNAVNIPVRKEYVYSGANYYFTNRYGGAIPNQKVEVFVEIQNKKENNLGIPLPKGIIRIYKHDSEGSLQFVGEDSIVHIPKDEMARIKLGDAFDVVVSRKQTNWQKIANDTYEAAFEISLRNHKKEDVVVKVVEPIPGDWTMLYSSQPYNRSEAFAAEFNISVPKDQEVKLTYRVRMKY
jgi:hypothetical protein